MKKAIALAAVLLASSAQATSGLDFGDLNYFLKDGQFNLTSNISVLNAETNDEANSARFETNGYVVDNRLSYGLADNLNAFVGLDYAFLYETELPGSSDSDNSGLSNPYLGANYRLINQNDALINLDFGVIGRINVMDAETGFRGEDGNFARGNHSLEVNSSIGRKWNEANEWRLTAAVTQQFAGESTQIQSGTPDQDYESDASTDMSLTAAYQYRPVQEFMMSISAQALRVGEVKSENTTSNFDTTEDAHTDLNFRFSAKYLVTETFIAKFNYGQSRMAEYDVKTNGTKSELKDRHENFYGFGIDWLF
jgi:hypothetical protein